MAKKKTSISKPVKPRTTSVRTGKVKKKTTAKEDARQAKMDIRRKLVLEYRMGGLNLLMISQALKERHKITASRSVICNDLAIEMSRVSEEKDGIVSIYRDLEVQRFDMILRVLYPRVRRGDMAAIDRWLKVSENRRKLLGLDVPVSSHITIEGGATPIRTINEVAEIDKLELPVSVRRAILEAMKKKQEEELSQ